MSVLYSSAASCDGSTIRPLIGGTSPKEGLVEVCVRGENLRVLMSSVTVAEASVMCRQLNQGTGECLCARAHAMSPCLGDTHCQDIPLYRQCGHILASIFIESLSFNGKCMIICWS